MKTLAIILLIPFLALTAYALFDVGYFGILDYHRHSSAGWQVFADLVISLILLLFIMLRLSIAQGRKFWPWMVATLFTGSIAPLFYLVIYGDPVSRTQLEKTTV